MKPASQTSNQNESNHDTESASHTFVLKVWAEEIIEGSKTARWRGRITHVFNGDYIYFEDLETLHSFIKAYLDKLRAYPRNG